MDQSNRGLLLTWVRELKFAIDQSEVFSELGKWRSTWHFSKASTTQQADRISELGNLVERPSARYSTAPSRLY
jgi:hypothetical protein